MKVLEPIYDALVQLPGEFATWAKSLNDASFATIMFGAAIILTFVIARSLR